MKTEEMEFTRKAYAEMLDWKQRLADKYALLVEGARRTGKTHLVSRFAKAEYDSHVFIDFSKSDRRTRDAKKAFEDSDGVADLIARLELIYLVRLVPGRSCLVFDEVQRFPTAREAIKHLVEYGRFHYIETGSLVGIRENVKDILVPSEEHLMKLHPLDFEEFLDAVGASMVKDAIRERFAARRPMGRGAHESALDLFRQYMVAGGMPQSVAAYVGAADSPLRACEEAKREILRLYEEDIGKYAKGYAAKVRSVFRLIPSALSRHEKKFRLSDIDRNARMRRYENAFLWLADSMVANVAWNSTDPDVGLGMNLDASTLKLYNLDTGLLLTQSMRGAAAADARLLRGVRYDNLGINEGMFFENAVAQALVAGGRELFFYSRSDRNDSANTMEIDFLVRNGIKICPVEVKSGQYRKHASLDRFSAKFKSRLGRKYVVCTGDYSEEGGVVYLPVYMAHCL